MAPGIAVRVRWTLPNVERRVRKFGTLRSLTFQRVANDGMDEYLAEFDGGLVDWWIAPLVDEKITWSGFKERVAADAP
jgi:hypothetical protein